MNEQSEDARIDRMLEQGRLTADEAERLRRSLDATRERGETFRRAAR